MTARSKGFWGVPVSSESSGALENSLGALGENLGLAGVVLLLDKRDRRRFLFFCYAS